MLELEAKDPFTTTGTGEHYVFGTQPPPPLVLFRNLYQQHRKALQFTSAGIMISVSLVLPSFYLVGPRLRGLWILSISIWAASTLTFLCLSARVLIDNGSSTLISTFVIGLCISNLPLPLQYGPLVTGLGLLSTIQAAPVIRSFFIGNPIHDEELQNVDLESGIESFNRGPVPSYGRISRTGYPTDPGNLLAFVGAIFTDVNNNPVVSSSFGSHSTNVSEPEDSEVSRNLSSG